MKRGILRLQVTLVASLLVLGACGDDTSQTNDGEQIVDMGSNNGTEPDAGGGEDVGGEDGGTNDTGNGDMGAEEEPLPGLSELDDGWNMIMTGGDTTCSRGTEYGFGVYPGATDKVVINFFGGGACWSEATCSAADGTFSEDLSQVKEALEAGVTPGLFNMEKAENPIRDWTHVVLPYCTGDIHWGDATVEYGTFEIRHRGAVNSRAVLDWVYENIPDPEKILVTGCSAGSYGSVMWSAHVMEHYPDATVYQFGDSGAGVITEGFFMESFPAWNATQAFPNWIDALDPMQVDILTQSLPDLYIGIAEAYPDNVLSQFNTRFDNNQVFFYEAMGGMGGKETWSDKMLTSVNSIDAEAPNFYEFTATGDTHCIIPFSEFYSREQNGVKLVDWLDDMVNDRSIEDVECAECTPPE